MIITVPADGGRVAVAEPDNFKQFHLTADGLDVREVVAALGDAAHEKGDGAHLWVSIDAVRSWVSDSCGPQALSQEWEDGFSDMLEFAKGHGWINEAGSHVQAHIEWPGGDGPVRAWQMPILGGNLWDLIEARVASTPDREMLVDDHGQRVTFREFCNRAEAMAAGFAAEPFSLREGDVVSWQLPTWIDSVVLAAALNRIGVVQNPIIPIYREREVGFCSRQARSRLLIVPGVWQGFDFGAMADDIAAGHAAPDDGGEPQDMGVLVATPGNFPEGDPASLPPLPAPPEESETLPMRWLLYTSGTTADPKGARHTDSSMAAISLAMGERFQCVPDDRSILAFPFTHIGGITWLFTSLQYGVCNLLTEAFAPDATIGFMARENVTLAGSGTPFHQAYLNAQRQRPDEKIFPNVRSCPGGGAPKPPQMHYDIKKELGGAGVVSGWGLTEAPILSLGSMDDPDEKLAETEGKPMPGVDLRVVKHDGTLATPGEEGELRVKAPQLMLGYLDESLNAEGFDENGYFRTGDLGMFDNEGYVIITGRLKDIIIRHGENISAKEIEDMLYEHPNVEDVAVVGLPDDVTGERACAVVSTPQGAEPLGFAQMQEFLTSKGLRKQAIPEQLEFTDVVPRNPSGKLLKQELRDAYQAKPFSRQQR